MAQVGERKQRRAQSGGNRPNPSTEAPGKKNAEVAAKKSRYVRRQKDPYAVIEQIKLWPSKTGVLHGVRSVKLKSGMIEVHTHCGQTVKLRNSRSGRLARHLRNKWYDRPCRQCRVPAWKIEKFSETTFA